MFIGSRKGQFFIVGAIMIILALYVLSGSLMNSRATDPSFIQDNSAKWVFDETEKGLYRIVMDNLTDELEITEFLDMQKDVALESGYLLEFRFDYDFQPYTGAYPNSYTMVIQSNDFYVEKSNRILPYYSRCVIADDGDPLLCDGLDIFIMPGYKSSCCDIYGLCC